MRTQKNKIPTRLSSNSSCSTNWARTPATSALLATTPAPHRCSLGSLVLQPLNSYFHAQLLSNHLLAPICKLQLRFTRPTPSSTTAVKKPANKLPKLEESCFLEVEEEGKFEALCLIARALKPKKLHIVARENNMPSSEIVQNYFGDCEYTVDSKSSCCVGSMDTFSLFDHFKGSRDLAVVLDTSKPKEEYALQKAFTVYLTTPAEKETVEKFTTTTLVQCHLLLSTTEL